MEEERKARQLELDAFMAKVAQMMGAQGTTTQQAPPAKTANKLTATSNMMGAQQRIIEKTPLARNGNKATANSSMLGAQQTSIEKIAQTRTGNKVSADSNMTQSLLETSNTGVVLSKRHRVIPPNHLVQAAKSQSCPPFKDGNI